MEFWDPRGIFRVHRAHINPGYDKVCKQCRIQRTTGTADAEEEGTAESIKIDSISGSIKSIKFPLEPVWFLCCTLAEHTSLPYQQQSNQSVEAASPSLFY